MQERIYEIIIIITIIIKTIAIAIKSSKCVSVNK